MSKIRLYITILFISGIYSCSGESGSNDTYTYRTPEQVLSFLNQVHLNYPSITEIEQVSTTTSVQGRPIYAIIISRNPGTNEMEPKIRLCGCIHGSEKITMDMLLRFLDYLTGSYGSDTEITSLINSRYIVIIPVINPDGLVAGTRYNANNVDLNRNFSREWVSGTSHGTAAFSEPESRAVRDYSLDKIFHTSISYHSGSILVNMPFDYVALHDSYGVANGTIPAEYTLVQQIALCYTTAGTFLSNPDLYTLTYMDRGTINGGDWYIANGSLQDWSYLDSGCLDLTIEVADLNPDTESEAIQVYNYNRDSMIAYIKKAGYGVYGQITDGTNPIAGVTVQVSGGDLITKTDSDGYYHCLLLPGTYDVIFNNSGSLQTLSSVTVPDSSDGIRQDITF